MVDIDLLVQDLRNKGYDVHDVNSVPENAGSYELTVDGTVLNLDEARELLEADDDEEAGDELDSPTT